MHCAEDSLCVLVHGFRVSRKDGTGGGRWGHPQGGVHMAVKGLWLGLGKPPLTLTAGQA